MDTLEFTKDFLEGVKSESAVTGEGSSASFASRFADYLIDAEILNDFIPAFYTGVGKRNKKLRVDGYGFDELDQCLTVLIVDYDGVNENRTLTRTEAEQLAERVRYFIDQSINGTLHRDIEISTPSADLVELIRENRGRIRRYQLLILTDATMSTAIRSIDSPNIDGIVSEVQIWDLNRLFKVCSSDLGRQIIKIDFREFSSDGIPCIEASAAETKDFKSYLCIIPGQMLADMYDKYGASLLEGNVRSFLSTKVAVNRKIRETILRSPERFFAYNNGISATAMDLSIITNKNGKFIVSANDFQIINGGQTTASLSNSRFRDQADLSDIYVQMKLTEIEETDEDRVVDLIQNISRSSNSQSRVSEADFFSTHPFHVRMEQFSRRIYAKATKGAQYETKWFYERTRGQYLQAQMRMSPSKKKQFTLQHPKQQVVTKTDFAKARNTWNGYPHIVSKGAQASFKFFAESIDNNWDKNDVQYNEKYFLETMALVLLFRHTEKLVPRQEWYEHGYRANIVTYTLAMLNLMIKRQFKDMKLDLSQIWHRQEVPIEVDKALINISREVYKSITDESRPVINVTQWCKRDACWDNVRRITSDLHEDIRRVLISTSTDKEAEKSAKVFQRIDSGVESQARILEFSKKQFISLMEFLSTRGKITQRELSALRIACQIPLKLPTPKQSNMILEALERAQSEGFKL